MPNNDDKKDLSSLHKLAECAELSREGLIFDAIKSNDIGKVEKVMERDGGAISAIYHPPRARYASKQEYGGQTTLLVAVKHSSYEMVEFIYNQLLVKGNKGFIDMADSGGDTPIIAACERGDKQIVEFLILNKADISKHRQKDGYRAIDLAIYALDEDVLNKLVEAGADIKDKSQLSRHTPLQVAIKRNNIKALDFLLSKLCGENSKLDRDDSISLLQTVIECNNPEAATLLKPKLYINKLTKKESSPICSIIKKLNKKETEIESEVQQLINIAIPGQTILAVVKRGRGEFENSEGGSSEWCNLHPSSDIDQSTESERVTIESLTGGPEPHKSMRT